MSTHVVMTTWGSFGDLHPYLAIALELQARGHRVTLMGPETYRAKVEALSLTFRPLRPDLPADTDDNLEFFGRLMDSRQGTQRLLCEIMMPQLQKSFDDVWNSTEDADLLLTHPIVFAGPMVAEIRKLRWVSAALAPISFFSVYDASIPPIAPAAASLLRFSFFRRLLKHSARKLTGKWLAPVQQMRGEMGLDFKTNPFFEGQHSPYRVLALFSRLLGEPQPDWSPNTVQTGFCFYDQRGDFEHFDRRLLSPQGDEQNALSPQLEHFLNQGEPPVVFTLGTSAVLAAGDFYHHSVVAAEKLGRRAVLLCGQKQNLPASLPKNVAAFDYAPHSLLFPRATAVVHQGGAGTTGQVLRAGKPMLVVPFSHDQPDNAVRMVKQGVARTLSRREYSGERCAAELQKLLGDQKYAERARNAARIVNSEDGAALAADVIEEELRKV